MLNIAIIGAGLSGLTAANLLQDCADITVFEKARGVGGRMSTRRAEPYFFDHGVPCFEAMTREFKEFLSPMISAGVVDRWDARFIELKDGKVASSDQWGEACPHYVGVPSMSAVAKYLAGGVTVKLGARVGSIVQNKAKWLVMDECTNCLGEFDWVILATPAEQASVLLPDSVAFKTKVAKVKMRPCFSLMLGLDEALPLEYDAALVHGEDIRWVSVNNSKPKRQSAFSLVVHSSGQWASDHIEDDHKLVIKQLGDTASEIIGCDLSGAKHQAVHAWRLSDSDSNLGDRYFIDSEHRIAACGDWFCAGGVESAFGSGSQLAQKMLGMLDTGEVCD